jgi:hypothetical protein
LNPWQRGNVDVTARWQDEKSGAIIGEKVRIVAKRAVHQYGTILSNIKAPQKPGRYALVFSVGRKQIFRVRLALPFNF